MQLLLCRHGETPWNREGRYQGGTDVPLSELGQAQARGLGERLAHAPITRAVASPLMRARATAEAALAPAVAAGRSQAVLTFDADLREISHGAWEGLLASEVEARDPALFARWRLAPGADTPAGPGAETFADVQTRAWAALERACAGATDDDVILVVAHDAVNRAILCRVFGLDFMRVWRFRQAPATLNVLAGTTLDDLEVVRLNDCGHSQPLLGASAHRAL